MRPPLALSSPIQLENMASSPIIFNSSRQNIMPFKISNPFFHSRSSKFFSSNLIKASLKIESIWTSCRNLACPAQYRNALIEDPANEDARYNYELTARLMNRQQQQKQQSKDDKEKKDKQKEQQENQQKQQQDQQQKEEEQQKQEQQKKDQKKEDAEKMLKALLQKEKEEMKKEKAKLNIDKAKKGKYW